MQTSVTDEQVRQLAETAKPYGLTLLAVGILPNSCRGPDTYRGRTPAPHRLAPRRRSHRDPLSNPIRFSGRPRHPEHVPPDVASEIMDGDPCVRAGMMRCEVHPCVGFPGDVLPAP